MGSDRIKSRRLVKRWNATSVALFRQLPALLRKCRTGADPVAVHDLRVSLRRLRLLLRLGRPFLDPAAVNRFVSWSRKVCDAAGPVRDLDVALEWLVQQPDAQELCGRTQVRRQVAASAFRKAIARARVPRCPLRLTAVQAREARLRLPKRFTKRVGVLRDEVIRSAPSYFRHSQDRRHELRRRIRQWRYLRELHPRLGGKPEDPSLKALLRLQEAMGELQNLDQAAAVLGTQGRGASRTLRSALFKDQERWKKDIRKRLPRLAD